MPRHKRHITPPDRPITREISPIYDDIFGPVAQREHKNRRQRGSKRASKAEREMETTLKGLDHKRRPEALARDNELHRAQQAQWAKDNPEKVATYQRNWRGKQPPELLRQYANDAYAADPEKKKARSAAYYAAHRDEINARRRAKRKAA